MIKKSSLILSSLCFLSLLGTSCRMGQKKEVVKEGLVLVNVLAKEYFDDCRIAGSINLSMDELKDYATKNWDKNLTHIVVYCGNYMCTASGDSAKMLIKEDLGFKNVWAYEGGSAEWKHKGYPVEGPCQQGYLNTYEQGGHEVDPDTPVITADELKAKIEKFSSK